MKRLFFMLVLLLSVICLAASCTPANQTSDETTGQTTEQTTAETTTSDEQTTDAPVVLDPAAVITLEELKQYTIICSDGASFEAANAAYTLKSGLGDLVADTTFLVKDDTTAESDCEILIGDTNRDQTLELKKTMRYQDYGYAKIGDKIVIFGHTSENVGKAIEMFIEEVVEAEHASDVFFADTDAKTVEGKYSINRVTVAETPIKKCVLVWAEDGLEDAETVARDIGASILKTTGFWIGCQSETAENPEGLYEILIGSTDASDGVPADLATGEAYIVSGEDGALVTGKDALGLYHAATLFNEAFVTEESRVSVDFESAVREDADDRTLRVMSFNVLCGSVTEARKNNVTWQIREYMPDSFGVQEATNQWMTILQERLPEYSSVGVGRNADLTGEHSAIFYKTAMFDLLDSGTYWLSPTPETPGTCFDGASYNRILTYAILQRKSDGLIFFHANTHINGSTSGAKELEVIFSLIEKYNPNDYPVVFTGDLNLNPFTDNYNQIIAEDYVDSSRVAEVIDCDTQTADPPYTAGDKIGGDIKDYVFIKTELFAVPKYRVCNKKIDGEFPSDHRAIFSDIYLYQSTKIK